MTRRIDAGPLLALLGAALLLVSLFLEWYEPGLGAWEVFEVLDLLLAALAVLAIAIALSMMGAPWDLDSRWLPWIAAAALAIVVIAALIDPPPVIGDEAERSVGAWLAFAGAAVLAAGALLAFARVSFSLSFEARDRRRRVAAVDAREETAPPPAPPAAAPAGSPVPAPSSASLLDDPAETQPLPDDAVATQPLPPDSPRHRRPPGATEEHPEP